MKSNGDDALADTRPAAAAPAAPAGARPADAEAPSPADATRTSQPDPTTASAAQAPRPAMAPHSRDPERYDILGEHGRGGLGRVSRAHDRELGRDIAIKELISRGHVGEVRFLREALITARLEHPGIVPVYEAGRWPDGTPFYAMKLVAGRPLRDLIAGRTTVDERVGLLHHVIAVADAIAYAHGRNIIHRDLKPANVIVGDFGETVVIDWGLAKDLSDSEESAVGGGPFRARGDDDLTSAGSVLGTPSYMAPEQARGEPVDQRADVFAIGAMLWELCSLQKVPPADARQRHRALRRAGIDPDLAAIIGKALDPEPARRYPDAGALAADLKAFKAGARIASRRYSLWALLAHWTRRHRALALTIAAASAIAAAGAVAYIRNIRIERDRAEAANNNLTLEHAELLLHSDPSAALAALSGYGGEDQLRRRRLVAEARGRGVAEASFMPHSDTIWFLQGDRTGAILSVGEDRRIQLTRGGRSTTIAGDVSSDVLVTRAPAGNVLAYATTPPGIAILDLTTNTTRRISSVAPEGLELSSDGSRLAAVDARGGLVVWSLQPTPRVIYTGTAPAASRLRFATPARLIVQTRAGMRAVPLDPSGGAADVAEVAGIVDLDARPGAVIAGTSSGRLLLRNAQLGERTGLDTCRKQVDMVRWIPGTDRVAFACRDGFAGIADYDLASNHLTISETFSTHGRTDVGPDAAGRYVVMHDESNTAYVYDLATRILTHYDGTAGQPSYVSPPTPEFDHVLVGDVNGTVRLWSSPSRAASAVLQASSPIYSLAFTPDSRAIVSDGADGILRHIDLASRSVTELVGHRSIALLARVSPDGHSILSYSPDGSVRVWSAGDFTPIRTFVQHAGIVEEADYIDGGRRVVSIGDDGRLLAWSPEHEAVTVLFAHRSPLTSLEVLKTSGHVVVKDAEGSVWDVALDGSHRQVRTADGAALTVLRASPDGRFVATGSDTGVVTVYDSQSWRVVQSLRTSGGVAQIQFDPLDRDLLIGSEAGHTQPGHVYLVALERARTYWHDLVAPVRDVAYSPDGQMIGFVCKDGGVWLHRFTDDAWIYARDHETDALSGKFSPDGKWFASTDGHGVVVVRDLALTFTGTSRDQQRNDR